MSTATDTFGSLVRQYILRQRLSYQEIADTLGYKSKTSVARIIQGETSYDLRQQFFSRLVGHYADTPQESAALKEALRFSRLTAQDQAYFRCYADLLHKDFSAESDRDYLCAAPQEDAPVSLRARVSRLAECSYHITLSIFGQPDGELILSLYQMLEDSGCAFAIAHYIFTDEDVMPMLRSVVSSASILFNPRYMLYRCPRAQGLPALDNQLLLQYCLEDGSIREDVLLPAQDAGLMLCPLENSDLTGFYSRSLPGVQSGALVREYRSDTPQEMLAACIAMQEQICELEKDCAVYSFKKGLSIEFIPPEIGKNAFLFDQLSRDEAKAVAVQLARIQKSRHQMLLTRRKPMHFVLSPAAFQRFIWTGRLVNHPPFLRPLTPKERYDVLTLIMDQLRENPYFSIRFTTDDIPPILTHMSLTCYQHFRHTSSHQAVTKGCLLIQPGLDSASRLACAELDDPKLAESYAHFFLEELIPQYTQPAQNTRHFLANMLDYLRTKIS